MLVRNPRYSEWQIVWEIERNNIVSDKLSEIESNKIVSDNLSEIESNKIVNDKDETVVRNAGAEKEWERDGEGGREKER